MDNDLQIKITALLEGVEKIQQTQDALMELGASGQTTGEQLRSGVMLALGHELVGAVASSINVLGTGVRLVIVTVCAIP
jgi:hypothetical protein